MKKILFMLAPIVMLLLAFQPLRFHTVSGKITNDQGNAMAAVSVTVKGTNVATQSTQDGTYQINISDKNATLVFSAVGYTAQEIKIKGRTTINVSLKTAIAELQEVIVTGHSQKSKKEMSYGLQGRVAGVVVRNPGANANIQIRGNSSFQNNNHGFYDRVAEDFNTEDYDNIKENRFLKASDNPLSTFSIDVDAASYSNVRRFLNQGQLPPAGAVRIEEMINYFKYEYPQPKNDQPFSINTEISDAPWNKDHKLVLIGLQGKKIANR